MKPKCPGNPLEQYSSRREFFYVGLLGGLGLTLPGFLQKQASAAQKFYETKNKSLRVCYISMYPIYLYK